MERKNASRYWRDEFEGFEGGQHFSDWAWLGTGSANTNGMAQFNDTPASGRRFYRRAAD